MANDLPSKWHLVSEAFGNERLDRAPQHVLFSWDDDRSEKYSEQELKEKIEADGREGDDPYVQAYRRLVESARSRR